MVTATYSMVQIISLIVPGLIFFLTTKSYFPIAEKMWESLQSPNEVVGVLVPLLFISLAYGLVIQGGTYILSTKIFLWRTLKPIREKLKPGEKIDLFDASMVLPLGRMIKELDGEQANMIKGVYHFHQTMMNMCVVLAIAFIKIFKSPENSADHFLLGIDIRLVIIGVLCLVTGYATKMSMDSVIRMYKGVTLYLAQVEANGPLNEKA